MRNIASIFCGLVLSIALILPASPALAANSAPTVGTVTPSSGSSNPNETVTFTATVSDPNGWQDIATSYFVVNATGNTTNSCYVKYYRPSNRIYLRDDANTAWLGNVTPGSSNIIENTYVKLNCSSTRISGSGNTLTVTWSLTFKNSYAGAKNTYMHAVDMSGASGDWIKKGSWTITNSAPTVGTVTPSSGNSNPDQVTTFTTTVSDPDGWQNISASYFVVNATGNTTRSCYVKYYRPSNRIYLRDDANTTWLGNVVPGSSNVIENSYVKLNCASTRVSGAGNTLTVTWSLTFKSAYTGAKNTYLYVTDIANASGVWTKKGSWNIGEVDLAQFTSQSVPVTIVSGQNFTASVTMKNTGSTTWTKAGNYKLGSQNPADNKIWGPYRVELSASDSIAPGQSKTFTFSAKAPTTIGTYNFQFKMVREWVRWFGELSVNVPVRVVVDAPAPMIVTTSLPGGIAGEEYHESLNTVDGTTPFVWTIATGSLPNGLTLSSSTGEISGTPAAAGTFTFTVKVTDALLKSAIKTLSIKTLQAFPPITDEELLDQTEAKSALYFYNEALANGFVKDTNYKDYASVSATGFGLAALCVMAERYQTTPAWTVTPAQAKARVNQVLDNCIFYQSQQATGGNNYGVAGFLHHFIIASGTRQGTCEVSTVDMALFLAGAITAGEYFGGEVKTKAAQIYSNVNWVYFLNTDRKQFSHGWFIDSGVMPATWDRPSDETMLVSLLAIGANPNNHDILNTMYSWPRVAGEYGGYTVVNSYFGSLFTYLYGHCFFDFEKLGTDNPSYAGSENTPVNWWTNSVNAALANRQFCIDNAGDYSSYGENSWGITICEYPNGQYSDFLGSLPCERYSGVPYHDGTIAPYAAISAIPLMRTFPTEDLSENLAFKALKYYYQTYYHHLWGQYGPKDSFNYNREFSNAYLGIDVGPQVLMIENYRSGLLWKNFMKNTKVVAGAVKIFGDSFLPKPTTIYVDIANAGDPSQDGSIEHPFDAIQTGIYAAGTNVIINIAPGLYIGNSGISGKVNVTLQGVIGDRDNPSNSTANTILDRSNFYGSVVKIDNSSNIVIDGIVIEGNNTGGWDYPASGILATNSDGVTLKNNIIRNIGDRESHGSGIMAYGIKDITITNNIISKNMAKWGGGIYLDSSTNATITNNDVIENSAWQRGGGLYINTVSGNVSIRNNRIYNNSVAEFGGGILLDWLGEPAVQNIEVANNIVVKNYTSGGSYEGTAGGGIVCAVDDTTITNNVIADNWSYKGGGIYVSAHRVAIKNNVITSDGGSGIYCTDLSLTPIITYNNVFAQTYNGYYECEPGVGSISEDPLFIAPETGDNDPYNDDYHFQSGSVCINAGDPVLQCNDKDGTRNDMGVYGGPYSLDPAPRVLAVPRDYKTIQTAIDYAIKGDVIKVAAGTYNESINLNKSGIILMGDSRNSIIRANPGSTAIYCENINDDMTLISDLTIQGQYGIFCAGTVKSLRIEDNNIRVSEGGPVAYGYGVYLENGASSAVVNNHIFNCGRAVHGALNNDLMISENTIDDCSMPGGGGIFINGRDETDNASSAIKCNGISRCLDGAITLCNNAHVLVANNVIEDNDSTSVNCASAITSTNSFLRLYNNIIAYNHASGAGHGGVLVNGKGVYHSGQLDACVNNNLFYMNEGADVIESGAALNLLNAKSSIWNNIFIGNSKSGAVAYSSFSGDNSFYNNDLWSNSCVADAVNFYNSGLNIAADPLFVSSTDFHLSSGSPCIDAGQGSEDVDYSITDLGIYGGPYPMPAGN